MNGPTASQPHELAARASTLPLSPAKDTPKAVRNDAAGVPAPALPPNSSDRPPGAVGWHHRLGRWVMPGEPEADDTLGLAEPTPSAPTCPSCGHATPHSADGRWCVMGCRMCAAPSAPAVTEPHGLKCHPPYFQALIDGTKTFEVRPDDRGGYAVGDLLLIREWSPYPLTGGGDYTGREAWFRVTYVLPGGAFGVEEGHVVMSVARTRIIAAYAPAAPAEGGPWTRHGHNIDGVTLAGPGRPPVARCGGPGLCPQCSTDAQAAQRQRTQT